MSGRGQQGKPASPASNDKKKGSKTKPQEKKALNLSTLSTSSADMDMSFDTTANSVKELQKMFEHKLSLITTKFQTELSLVTTKLQTEVDTLYNVVKMKDEVIGKLQTELGEVKQSLNYLHKETSDNHKLINETNNVMEKKIKETNHTMQGIKSKNVDLEDRSRRCNLVFFNIPEADKNEPEDCEKLIHNVLDNLNILSNEEVWIDRAHRLGRKKTDADKPRPIIVKFCYFKQKDFIIKNAFKFRNCETNVSEDFSKETLEVRKKLLNHGKMAKQTYNDPVKSLVNYKANYKRLTLTYSLNKKDVNAKKVTRHFNLDDISSNVYWFVLKPINGNTRPQVSESQNNGYQLETNNSA